jgi:uncharacterized protein
MSENDELKGSSDNKSSSSSRTRERLDEIPVVDNGLFRIVNLSGSKGRGLFAVADIAPHTLIHVAPCIATSRQEYDQFLQHTVFEHYLFNDKKTGNKLLALGYGSLFNHCSRQPNVDYRIDSENLLIRYSSGHRPIAAGEELCIYYGDNLWFDDAEANEGGGKGGGGGRNNEGPNSSSSDSDDALDEKGLPFYLGRMEIGEEEE